MDYRAESPEIMKNFLTYHDSILGHSKKTVQEYFLDLRTFFRFLKLDRSKMPTETPLETFDIMDIDLSFIETICLTDVYNFISYMSNDRNLSDGSQGVSSNTRARKVATIRVFFKYLVVKEKLLTVNPVQNLDTPVVKKSLPQYLTLDESMNLLESVEGKNQVRDYCILCLFLNCGMRISELVGLDLTDIKEENIRILGKGNKERILFLNESCMSAIQDWLEIRSHMVSQDVKALFVTSRGGRISSAGVHKLVKKHLDGAGLDSSKLSSHKLRHTAATLMVKNGVDVRTLQEVLGHENLNTTQIYTHVDNDNLRSAMNATPLSKVKNKNKSDSEDV